MDFLNGGLFDIVAKDLYPALTELTTGDAAGRFCSVHKGLDDEFRSPLIFERLVQFNRLTRRSAIEALRHSYQARRAQNPSHL